MMRIQTELTLRGFAETFFDLSQCQKGFAFFMQVFLDASVPVAFITLVADAVEGFKIGTRRVNHVILIQLLVPKPVQTKFQS